MSSWNATRVVLFFQHVNMTPLHVITIDRGDFASSFTTGLVRHLLNCYRLEIAGKLCKDMLPTCELRSIYTDLVDWENTYVGRIRTS